jgi:tetratricopeptide (TPR) repeat protein
MDAFGAGDLDKAAGEFKRAIELEPENAEAHTNLGKVLVRQEQFDAGIAELQLALQYDPEDPAAYYVLGFALRAVERNVEASEAYEMFLKLMPEARDSGKMRDWVKHIKGAAGSAPVEDTIVDDEQIVTEMDKKYKAALTRFQEGDADTALRECVRILNEDPTHFRTRVLLGRVYLRQKSLDNAIEQIEGALITRPDYTEALYFLGQAHEKRGALDLATKSYNRYIEVAPQGPRAERLKEWLSSHNTDSLAGASQVQCELCLRFFPGSEVTQHEGKPTCRNCLVVMGAAPTIMTPLKAAKTSVSSSAVEVKDIAPVANKSKIPMVMGLLVLVLAAAGGFAYKTHRLDSLLIKYGLMKAPVIKSTSTDTDTKSTFVKPVLDLTKIKVANEPRLQVFPYANWSYTPKLEGIEEADEKAPGWTRELILQNHPPGMELKGDAVVWKPTPTDFEALKKGETYAVSVAIKGSWKNPGPDGQQFELFSVAKSFTLTSQFGYEAGPEFDLGLDANEPVAFAAGDLNGDNHPDLIAASGQFRHGALRLYINRGENQFAAPTQLSSGARFSTAWIGDLFSDKSNEVLAANWQAGQLKSWFVDNNQPVAGPTIPIGAGPVAIAAADLDGSKKLHIAVLLSVGHALAVTTLSADRKFGEVTLVPLQGGGGSGFVLPWNSQEAGPGFVVVMPLSDTPVYFVAFNKGAWGKPISSAVSSGDAPTVVAAAALSGGPDKPGRLAVATASSRSSQLVMMQEKNGKFDVVGAPLTFNAPALNALACDLSKEGKDDLLVITPDEARIYFCDPAAGFAQGPAYKAGNLRGPAVVLASRNARPDVVLLNETSHAVILRALSPDSAPVRGSSENPPDVKAPKAKDK